MADRIADLSPQTLAALTWVLEIDAPDGVGTIAASQKITGAELASLMVAGNWIDLTLINGWTGVAKYRIDAFGYLELWYSIFANVATDGEFAAIPIEGRLDYFHSEVVADGTNTTLQFSTFGGSLIIDNYASIASSTAYYTRVIKLAP